MHNSKFHPNNGMVIHWGRFGWRMLPIWLLPAALCQHRHKQDATHYWGSKRSSILRKKSPVERNIVRWNRRLDWIAWLLQTNLSSTVLNTKFENAHLFLSQLDSICWKFAYKQSLKPNVLLICKICSAPRSMWSLIVVFSLKTKLTPSSRLHSRQQKSNKDSDAEPSSLPASLPVVSNIAGYNLVQDKIIYVWDGQRLRSWRATKAEKERKKLLAIEAALASNVSRSSASSSLKIC